MNVPKDTDRLLKEIKELEDEIEEIKKRIPPHSVKYEIIQLLDEKEEEELTRKKFLLKT
jgi:cell division septum initiation protein DivIVA